MIFGSRCQWNIISNPFDESRKDDQTFVSSRNKYPPPLKTGAERIEDEFDLNGDYGIFGV
jgi:hypothetical protein